MTPPAASAAAPAINPRRTVRRSGPVRPPAAPRRPRRISGPVPARRINDPARLVEAVASNRLLDRLISGRIWIGVIAFALIGIVTMQLGLLKLNAGIGRSLAREALLQRENATLSTENSEMAAGERIETQAQHIGMELIPSGALHFLAARPSIDASRGAAALRTSLSTAAGSATTTSATATAPGESSSGTETGAATSGAQSSSEVSTAAGRAPVSTPAAGSTSETASATSSSAATPEASGAPAAGSTSETHPSETASPNNAASGGAGEAPGASGSTSTGGGTTPGG